MEKIVWSERNEVGVKEIDDQHKKIIGMINLLIDSNVNDETPKEVIIDLVSQMSEYALQHFKTEEGLMKKYGYPRYDVQLRQHAEFKTKIIEVAEEVRTHGNDMPQNSLRRIVTFLLEWWMEHILESDMQYKTFFQEKGVR